MLSFKTNIANSLTILQSIMRILHTSENSALNKTGRKAEPSRPMGTGQGHKHFRIKK